MDQDRHQWRISCGSLRSCKYIVILVMWNAYLKRDFFVHSRQSPTVRSRHSNTNPPHRGLLRLPGPSHERGADRGRPDTKAPQASRSALHSLPSCGAPDTGPDSGKFAVVFSVVLSVMPQLKRAAAVGSFQPSPAAVSLQCRR